MFNPQNGMVMKALMFRESVLWMFYIIAMGIMLALML